MYITLKKLFGESGDYYDDWKGSFSFPFLIYFCSDEEIFGYLMDIYNTRSSIEFAVAKLIYADDQQYERGILHEPFQEFPREEINYFIDFFVGFLTGYFETAKSQVNYPRLKAGACEDKLGLTRLSPEHRAPLFTG